VDAGVSGTRTDRPALAAALVSLEQGDALVVYSLSRLSRGLRHLIDLADILDARGVALVSLTESLDTTSASGRLFFHMMAALSQFERDLLSERVAAALAQKRARGERLGRPRYENPDAERLARDLGHRGASLRMIAAALLQAGHRPQRASAWSAKVVRDLLRREIGT
jgi:DNA invertase Pin-like site-specific DNA recombinase